MRIESQSRLMIGQTRVTIKAEGCFQCGQDESLGSEEVQHFMVVIGNRRRSIVTKRCARCAKQRGSAWAQKLVTPPDR